jgi:hypothetical protein
MQTSLRTFAIATSAFACATLLSFGWSEQSGVSLSVESAQARIGRPGTPLSVAGVARRHYRRAAVGAAVVGAGLAAGAYYSGYGTGGYYGAYSGYPSGYYGGYAAGGYPGGYYGAYGGYPSGYYGAYAAGGYPGGYYGGYDNGVYANRSYVTGRPTLIPRRYGW